MKGDLPRVTEHFINMKADSSIFTISATGSALPSAPALENRKSEARSWCAQVRWRNRHQNCMRGPPQGHPFHPTTSRWASTTLILCHCSPGVGGRKNRARHTPSFSSTPILRQIFLPPYSPVTFLRKKPAGVVASWEGRGGTTVFWAGLTPEWDDQSLSTWPTEDTPMRSQLGDLSSWKC